MSRLTATITVCALAVLSACSNPKSREKNAPILSAEFYGAWINASPRFHSWWEISSTGAVGYGDAGGDGKCTSVSSLATETDQLEIHYASPQNVTLHLASGDLLLMSADNGSGVTLYKRVDADSICRRSDGSYAEGAPHVAASH
jgi:hypothetical protein